MRFGVVKRVRIACGERLAVWLWLAAGCGPRSVSTKPERPTCEGPPCRFLVRVSILRSSESAGHYNFAGADLRLEPQLCTARSGVR